MSDQTLPDQPEFSCFVDCGKLRSGSKTYKIEANANEREALSSRFSIDSLESLVVEISLCLGAGGVVLLTGKLKAALTQTCVVSLKPLVNEINLTFDRTYSASAKPFFGQQEEPDEDGSQADDQPEPPEPLENGGIDIGEVASEELAIEIDPFPRLVGVEFDSVAENNEDQNAEELRNPFAVLEKLKKKQD